MGAVSKGKVKFVGGEIITIRAQAVGGSQINRLTVVKVFAPPCSSPIPPPITGAHHARHARRIAQDERSDPSPSHPPCPPRWTHTRPPLPPHERHLVRAAGLMVGYIFDYFFKIPKEKGFTRRRDYGTKTGLH